MSCRCAHWNPDEGRYICEVSGSDCMYMIPSAEACAVDYGEGPDVEETQEEEL